MGRQGGGGDFGPRLGGQDELHAVDEQAQLWLRLGVTGEDDLAAVGSRQMDVDHLHGRELLQRATRGEAGGECGEPTGERDLKTVGEEGDEDVSFDALVVVMEDGTDRQVALEVLERLLDIP